MVLHGSYIYIVLYKSLTTFFGEVFLIKKTFIGEVKA